MTAQTVDLVREIPLEAFLSVAAAMFAIGVYGVLVRRNAILILMSVELMLTAVNINLVAFAAYLTPAQEAFGLIFAIFIITVAAAEVGLALGIIIRLYRSKSTVNVDEVDLMKW